MKKTSFLLFAIFCFVAAPALAQSFPRVGIRGTELRHLDSKIIEERFEIDVSLPKGYAAGNRDYPVLYVIDAETNFGATSYITNRLMKNEDIPKVIVVGIAYDTSYEAFYDKRQRDLTPKRVGPGYGGASKFAEFIETELIPFIEANYRTSTTDRALYGHSYGGLFGLYMLLEYPDVFPRILALSPSVWFGEEYLIPLEQAYYKSGHQPKAVVYTAVGEWEGKGFKRSWNSLVKNIKAHAYTELLLKTETLEKENHRSIFGVGFTNGLRYIFSNNP